ncbi:MAG: CZB domain-containing protein [Parvularcula sp.]
MAVSNIFGEIQKALTAHGAWKMRIQTSISRKSIDADPDTVCCDNLCEFGKWLYGPSMDEMTRAGKPYQVIRRLHAEFHECAAEVLREIDAGNMTKANEIFHGEYEFRSHKLSIALSKWRRELLMQDAA